MSNPIFFDPDRRRWKRIRKSIDVAVVVFSLLIGFFAITVVRKTSIPNVLLADQKKNYRALKPNERKKPRRSGPPAARRWFRPRRSCSTPAKASAAPSTSPGTRPATAPCASTFTSSISSSPSGSMSSEPTGICRPSTRTNTLYNVMNNGRVANIDAKLMPFIKSSERPGGRAAHGQ